MPRTHTNTRATQLAAVDPSQVTRTQHWSELARLHRCNVASGRRRQPPPRAHCRITHTHTRAAQLAAVYPSKVTHTQHWSELARLHRCNVASGGGANCPMIALPHHTHTHTRATKLAAIDPSQVTRTQHWSELARLHRCNVASGGGATAPTIALPHHTQTHTCDPACSR